MGQTFDGGFLLFTIGTIPQFKIDSTFSLLLLETSGLRQTHAKRVNDKSVSQIFHIWGSFLARVK